MNIRASQRIVTRLIQATFFVAIVASVDSSVLVVGGQSPKQEALISVRVVPSSDAALNGKVLAAFDKYFEPKRETLQAPTTTKMLAERQCGRVDEQWIVAFAKQNNLTVTEVVPAGRAVVLPPCPNWTKGGAGVVTANDTVSNVLLRETGQAGPTMQARVAQLNGMEVDNLDKVPAGASFELPFRASRIAYRVRPEFENSLQEVITALAVFSTTSARMEVTLALIAADDASCSPGAESPLPFNADHLAGILEYNARMRAPSRIASVAVVDTGIDKEENRLFLWSSPADGSIGFNADATPGYPADWPNYAFRGHGTHVAGLAQGGIQQQRLSDLIRRRMNLRIVNLVSFDRTANGETYSIPLTNLQEAVTRLRRDPPAPIINLSVETSTELDALREALSGGDYLVIAAAGNDGRDIDLDPVYPARFSHDLPGKLLTVAAYESGGALAGFSNYGPQSVDIAAPGCNVESFIPGGKTAKMSGTSQAAPFVTLAAALLYSEGFTPRRIRNRIMSTVDLDSSLKEMVAAGGRLSIENAVDIHHDLVRLRGEGTFRTGRLSTLSCLTVGASCMDVANVVRVVMDSSGTGRAWLLSTDGEIVSRQFAWPRGTVRFGAETANTTELIDWAQIVDVIFATVR